MQPFVMKKLHYLVLVRECFFALFPQKKYLGRLQSVLTGLRSVPLVWDHRAPGIYKSMTGTYITLVMSEKTAAVNPAPFPIAL